MENLSSSISGCSRRALLQQMGVGIALASPLARAVAGAIGQQNIASSGITALPATELSQLIKTRKVSCVEVMQAYLAQIDSLNESFNAIVSRADEATLIKQSQQRDSELARGEYRGWMHGFPHAVKDLADAAGFITSKGSPLYKNNLATSDSIHVERIKRAGAIIIGKTNVPEFGLGSQSYNPVFGATLNAWDGFSTAGGSSGGAAAALALHMVPVADGSDLMGSLRNPAGFNNVIGFRPTPGRVPLSPLFVEELPCNGPMGRNVSDTAMLLSTMAGYAKSAPTSLDSDPQQFTQPLAREWRGTKIGWLGDLDGYLPMEEGVLELCSNALQSFGDIGCIVDEATLDFPMEQLWQTWLTYRHWLVQGLRRREYQNPQQRVLLKPEAIWEVEGGQSLTANDVFNASVARAGYYGAVLKAFEQFDYLVLPTAQVFPFDAKIHWPKSIAGKTMDTYHRWMEVVIPGTLSGCPVVNVPAGFGRDGLPMGLQIIGPRYRDFATLQIAYAYEQAARWNIDHLPPALAG